jgi:predicted permease
MGTGNAGSAAIPRVVGARLLVNGTAYTVVGVAAPGFAGTRVGTAIDFWVPITMHVDLVRMGTANLLRDRDQWWLVLVGRLAPGASIAATQARISVTVGQYVEELAPRLPPYVRDLLKNARLRVELLPGARGASNLRADYRQPALALMAGVGLLLLVVCLNVSHLLLARAARRQGEMNIRAALGASRGRLVRQSLAEGLLLSLLGAAAGLLAMRWMADALVSLAVPAADGHALAVGADGRVVAFTAGLAAAAALLLGLIPAWQSARTDLFQGLRSSAAAVAGRRGRAAGRMLVLSQVVFSLVLLVGAALLSSSLRRLRTAERGFDEQHLVLLGIDLRAADLRDEQQPLFQQELLRRAAAVPGVQSVSLANFEILDRGRWSAGVSFLGQSEVFGADMFAVTSDYFSTVGMSLVAGRTLTGDDRQGGARVAVVNEAVARRLRSTPAAMVGRRFRFGDPASGQAADKEVVGVVRDARVNALRDDPRPTMYVPSVQWPEEAVQAVQVRAAGDSAMLQQELRRALKQTHPRLRVTNVRTMTSQIDGSLRRERLLAGLSTAFGLTALFLVCLGLYGVISQWAVQRTREIGVRIALGATGRGVRWLVLRQALALVGLGVVAGLPAAAVSASFLREMLFGVSPADPTTMAAMAAALLAVTTAAAYLPARRASRVEPMTALRSD